MNPRDDQKTLPQTLANDAPGQPTPEQQQTLEQPDGPPIPILATIPGYRLKPEIARGGMGIVYAAECLTFGRDVAVKVMKPGMSAASFNREARITARLPHPGIPPVHALGTLPNGLPYLVMKLIRGETLDQILKKRADLETGRGRLVAAYESICQAVGYAHSQGIIHRDLKPSNMMVGAFGEVQVMDWGLAKEIAGGEEVHEEIKATEAGLTVAGQVKGTPAYMAPEQARGEEVDARADVFALGGILAAILTGHAPFGGTSVLQTISRAARCDLGETGVRLNACGADPELVSLCRQCLMAKPNDRPSNGAELAKAVANYRAEVEQRLKEAEMARVRAEEVLKHARLGGLVTLLSIVGIVGAALVVALAAGWGVTKGKLDEAENANKQLAVARYGAAMKLAHQEWSDANFTAMGKWLVSEPKLRGWEWRYLYRLHEASQISIKGNTSNVCSAKFSPDGKRIVTASENTAKVWDATTGNELISIFTGQKYGVNSAQFSHDGNRIVTASNDNTAKVWDANTGSKLLSFKGHTDWVNSAQFSPDGNYIVTASNDKAAKVWDAKTGTEILSLNGHILQVICAYFGSHGNRILTASQDTTAKVWDANTGKELFSLNGHTDKVNSAHFSPDGNRIITASYDNIAKVWDANTGKELFSLNGHTDKVNSAHFSPDGNRIVTASSDKTVKLWDPTMGLELLSLKGHTEAVNSAQFSPDGKRIVTAGHDGTVIIWDSRPIAESFAERKAAEAERKTMD